MNTIHVLSEYFLSFVHEEMIVSFTLFVDSTACYASVTTFSFAVHLSGKTYAFYPLFATELRHWKNMQYCVFRFIP